MSSSVLSEDEKEMVPEEEEEDLFTEMDFKSLVQSIGSTKLDSMPSQSRNETINMTKEIISECTLSCFHELGSNGLALKTANSCRSLNSMKRVASLFLSCFNHMDNNNENCCDDDDTKKALCFALCRVLTRSNHLPLLQSCCQALSSSSSLLKPYFHSILVDQANGTSKGMVYSTAASILVSSNHNKEEEEEIVQLFLKCTVHKFASHDTIVPLARPFLSTLSQTIIDTLIVPTCELKLRANPEASLETIHAILSCLENGLQEEATQNLTALAIKQFKSSKPHMKLLATQFLVQVTRLSSSCSSIVTQLCNALSSTQKTTVTLTQPDQRLAAYTVLNNIGIFLLDDSTKLPTHELSNAVLKSICTVLVKDISGSESQIQGFYTLLTWMLLSKQQKQSKDGYTDAIQYLKQIIMDASKPSNNDFRHLFGFLVQAPWNCTQHLDQEFVKTILVDLFQSSGVVLKACEAMIELGEKKFAKSDAVPQIDAVLATYLILVYTEASSSTTKLSSVVEKVILSGKFATTAKNKLSFLYASSIMTITATNSLMGHLCPIILALSTKLTSSSSNLFRLIVKDGNPTKVSAATHLLACCIANPHHIKQPKQGISTITVYSAMDTILNYSPSSNFVADALISALTSHVNATSLEYSKKMNEINQSPDQQPSPTVGAIRGKYSPTAGHKGLDCNIIRRVAMNLLTKTTNSDCCVKAILLSHVGSTLKVIKSRQRNALVAATSRILSSLLDDENETKQKEVRNKLCQLIVTCASSSTISNSFLHDITTITTSATSKDEEKEGPSTDSEQDDEEEEISQVIYESTLSLMSSLSIMGGGFDPAYDDVDDVEKEIIFARTLCVDELGPLLSTKLQQTLVQIESLKDNEIQLYRSVHGIVFNNDNDRDSSTASIEPSSKSKTSSQKSSTSRSSSSSSKKKKGGMSFGEDEWESQMKKEIAAKKKKKQQTTKDTSMDVQEKKLLELQKRKVARLVDGDFHHVLRAIQTLCNADVEIGNACLPALSTPVLAAAVSHDILLPCCKDACIHTLSILASCVYEIEEDGNNNLTKALLHSCTRKSTENDNSQLVTITPLSSSTAAASVIQYVMDEYDDTLSKSSFFFLFPILRAALMGPKPCVGCEGALLILNRHAVISDIVVELRKEMALSVLELIRHDRAQTFLDPTPFDTLVAIYTSTFTDDNNVKISASELGPLLGDIGALCPTNNNRCASMKALASLSQHQSLNLNRNPLVENRIWLNCFSTNQQIRDYAKEAFSSDRPSKLFVVPMLPLLSNENAEIASMAADALATGMTLHLDTMEKNMIRLCNLYIDSYPTVFDDKTTGTPSTTNTASPPANLLSKPLAETKSSISSSSTTKKTKSISTGLPKKTKIKSSSKGSSSIAALTTTKKKPSSKKVRAALAPKPQERTVDLAAQFQSKSVQMSATVERDNPEKIQVRRGVLRAIASITNNTTANSMEVFPFTVLELLVRFLSAYCLADGNEKVRDEARNATRDAVATHGGTSQAIAFLLPHFETVLSTGKADVTASLSSDKVHTTSAAANRRKEGVVVALGSVALHLEENDDKIDTTLDMLLDALLQPTSTIAVQSSIALCLSKLMKKKRAKTRIPDMIQHLLNVCLNDTSPKIRRGGAYGLSAVVKGSGIATLKKDNIVPQLQQAITGQKTECKEGALLAIEQFSSRLGLLFEPYVIVLLPSLLKAFSDNATSVRDAAAKAAGFIMSRLSAHGVKLVMPAVLSAFDEPEWRTKQASIHMLGAMSHCAPKQLASCLPKVVPKLTEAFSDTHPKVKASAQEALDEISTVIRNPEISSIAKDLLKALTDPAQGTVVALESLIETEFVHAIDAPSLALIVPVLHRGLRDRLATTKRYGALITGNICTMIQDPRDFVPYLSILLPDLKTVLLDPIPDVRSTSAKALGFLTRSLGEATFPDLRPWLIDTLRSEVGSSVERSGAAQGLTEVLTAGGPHLVQKVMTEEILPLKSYPQASTREGVLWVLTFLPTSSANFAPLIDASFPALIRGLSDESEPVRDVAMRAGRVIIRSHGKANLDKILPSLEEGLWDDDYRIRVASLMLLGDLLGMIGGITTNNRGGDGVDTQEDIRQAERAQAQIALVLGMETRRRVLSSLYMRRNDTAAVVRQNAIQVWKSVVSVTPRTLRDILQVLVGQIITALASGNPEQTEVAGRCLGDVVRKLGDAVLPEIVPVLRDSLLLYDDEDSVTTRRGACVGLSEVLTCSTKEQLEKYLDIFTKAVQNALCDDDEDVRELAASCFQTLYNTVGNRAFEQVVPVLLVAMGKQNHDEAASRRAIVGLTGILKIRSRDLLPYLIPRLLQKPITEAHANALGSIAQVTGSTIATFFSTILPSLLSELASSTEVEDAIRSCVQSICASVDETGIQTMVGEIASLINHSDNENIRVECSWTIQSIIEERKDKMDFYEQIPIMLRDLLNHLNDQSPKVLKSVHASLGVMSKHVPAEELVKHVEFIRNLIASIVSDARRRKGGVGDGEFLLPGINMPKGLDPFLPIFQRGILYGDSNIREASAAGLGELITLTAKKYLAGPSTIKMTGPLLRIVGDRNPAAVKVAIINTLGLILTKGGPALRAFVPQFQTTFVKALSDPYRQVRLRAISALGLLMPLSTRLDPLIKELVSSSLGKGTISSVDESAGKVAIQTATLEALAVVLKEGGKKAKLPDSIPSALEAGKELLTHEDEGVREGAAKVLGATCGLVDPADILDIIENIIISNENNDSDNFNDDSVEFRHGQSICCFHLFSSISGNQTINIPEDLFGQTVAIILERMMDEKTVVREAACQAVGSLLGSASDVSSCLRQVETTILNIMVPKENTEVLKSLAKGLCVAVRMNPAELHIQEGDGLLLKILDGALKCSMQCTQRVQLAFHNFLWLALDVEHGETGLNRYAEMAMFENVKSMKSLYSKILVRIKLVEL